MFSSVVRPRQLKPLFKKILNWLNRVKDHGTVSTGTVTVDVRIASHHILTVGGNITVSFVGWTSGVVEHVSIKLTNAGAHTVTWGAEVDFPGGTEPSWTSAGTDFILAMTDNAGTDVHITRSITDSK